MTSSASQIVSTVMKPRSWPPGIAYQPQAAIVRNPSAVAARETTTVNDTRPMGNISSR